MELQTLLSDWWVMIGSGAALGLIYAIWIEPYWLSIRSYRLSLVEKPTVWIKVGFLSDFHAGQPKSKKFYDKVVRVLQHQKLDLILLGGDFVERHASHITQLASLKKLKAPLGKYFILGNHDFMDDPEQIRQTISSWGFEDLSNERRMIEKEGKEVELIGLDDVWYGKPDLSLIAPTPSSSPRKGAWPPRGFTPFVRGRVNPRILLAHEPDILVDIEEKQADLILLGHTHGGQVRVPAFGAPYLPGGTPRVADRGLKYWKGIPVVISQGLGESKLQLRFWCRPQIVVVEVGI